MLNVPPSCDIGYGHVKPHRNATTFSLFWQSHSQLYELSIRLELIQFSFFCVCSRCMFGNNRFRQKEVNYRQEEKKILDSVLGVDVYDKRIRPSGLNSTGKWIPFNDWIELGNLFYHCEKMCPEGLAHISPIKPFHIKKERRAPSPQDKENQSRIPRRLQLAFPSGLYWTEGLLKGSGIYVRG